MTYEQILQARPVISFSLLVLLLVWESAAPFFAFFSGAGARARHGLGNIVLGVVNAVVTALVFAALWLGAAVWAERNGFGLLNLLAMPGWLHALGALLLLDLWTYWWHRINHVWPFLWRFHRVHHSDPNMDVTTANRFHLGEMAMSGLLRAGIIVLVGARFWEVALYELLMFSVVQFHHANIGVGARLDRWLRVLIVTPEMHKVHHSVWQPETDSNYASLLSVWDRLFASFRLNADPKSLRLGLDGYDRPEHQSVAGMLRTPFKGPPRNPVDSPVP